VCEVKDKVDTLPFSNVSDISGTMADSSSSKAPSSAPVSGARAPGSYTRRRASAAVVPYGHASHEVCETIYRQMLSEYGLGGLTASQRDEFLWCLVEVLVHGTSTEINWADVWFTYEGTALSMARAFGVVKSFIGLSNPMRVWVKDFRKGELPMRMSEFLNNSENIEVRQVVASNYGTTVDNARFCFDTAGALVNSGLVLSHSDILLVNMLSSYTIQRAQSDGQARGAVQATSDHSGTVGGVKAAGIAAAAPVAPSERAAFKAMR